MIDQFTESMLREARRFDREGRIPEAIAAYQRILARQPGLPESWYNLAVLQRRSRDFPAALASYQEALDRGVSKPEEVHLNRGVIYADHLRDDEAAERELGAALVRNPAYIPALLNLANLHEDLGRREQAIAAYDQILALDPDCFEALARYANLHAFRASDDPLIGKLQDALAKSNAGPAQRASLGFALGRALDACAAYGAAFDVYAQANRDSRDSARREALPYGRRFEEDRVARLIRAFPARPNAKPSAPNPSTRRPRPIFICGMFRSGSTLIEQLLARHGDVASGGEIDFIPHLAERVLAPFPESISQVSSAQLESLAVRYLDTLGALGPASRFVTDKRPDNFQYIGLIKRLFPDAKIVHTTRNALDNCLSIYFLHLDHRMSYALDLLDIGHYYRQYQRLMVHWKAIYGADIIDVNYDELVHRPEPAAERLFAFLGLDWDERRLMTEPAAVAGKAVVGKAVTIKTASVWQVREPLYTRSSGRASHYAQQLEALRRYLDDGAEGV